MLTQNLHKNDKISEDSQTVRQILITSIKQERLEELGLCNLKERGLGITKEQLPSRQKEITKIGSPGILRKYMASEQGTIAINWNRPKFHTELPYYEIYEVLELATQLSCEISFIGGFKRPVG